MQARRLMFLAPRRVELAPVDVPDPGPGQVLVRTLRSGISTGTELLCYRGPARPRPAPGRARSGRSAAASAIPFPYGYSCVGAVERSTGAVPAGTAGLRLPPAPGPVRRRRSPTSSRSRPAPTRGRPPCFPLVETALQLSLDAGPVAHETVVVLGLGAVGMITALLLQRAGADRRWPPTRWPGDGSWPCRWASRRSPRTSCRPASRPAACRCSSRCPARPPRWPDALPLLAHEGTALVGSWYGEQEVRLPLGGAFHRRRLTIRSSQVSTIPAALAGRWDVARRRRVAAGLLDVLPLAALATTELPVRRGGPGLRGAGPPGSRCLQSIVPRLRYP